MTSVLQTFCRQKQKKNPATIENQIVTRFCAEVHALAQQLVGDLAHIVHFRNRHHGIAPQVRVHDDRLWIGVADHAQSLVRSEEHTSELQSR